MARKEFSLPPEDAAYLDTLVMKWETVSSQGMQWLLIEEYPISDGYNAPNVSLAIKIESGYPRVGLDMVYFFPPVLRSDGVQIGALTTQQIDGKQFQRWSRHRTPQNPWREEVDNISTHLSMVNNWLDREFVKNPRRDVTRA